MDFSVQNIQKALNQLERRYHTPYFYELTLRLLGEAWNMDLLEGTPKSDLVMIAQAARLHDIGKLSLPRSLLDAPALTPYEEALLQKHAEFGRAILAALTPEGKGRPRMICYAMDICQYHHEQWDGNGYPAGLKGDQIPAFVRVVSLADFYDTLRTPQRRRAAMSHQSAKAMILNFYQGVFQPELLTCFHGIIDSIVADLYLERNCHG